MADRSSTAVSTATTERERAIEQALNQIERRFGKGAIMKLGEVSKIHVEVIPTGSIALDLALGVGGIPRGRITEIYGPEASGKTTLCQHIIANAQRAGGYAAFIDAEHALDRAFTKATFNLVKGLLNSLLTLSSSSRNESTASISHDFVLFM